MGVEKKDKMMQFRLSEQGQAIVLEAAAHKHLKQSDYMRESVLKQAEIDLANKRSYIFPEDKMKDFMEALDKPAEVKPRLKKLLSKKTILER